MLSKILEHYMDADMEFMADVEAEAHVRGCIEKLHMSHGCIFTANDHPSMRLRIDVCGIRTNPDGFVVVPVEAHNPDGFGFEEWTPWGKFAPTELFMILQPILIINPIPTRAMFDDSHIGNGDGLASDEREVAAMVAAELEQIGQMQMKAHNTTPTHRIWLDDELWETTSSTEKAFESFRKYASEKCDDTYRESIRIETIHHMDAPE